MKTFEIKCIKKTFKNWKILSVQETVKMFYYVGGKRQPLATKFYGNKLRTWECVNMLQNVKEKSLWRLLTFKNKHVM